MKEKEKLDKDCVRDFVKKNCDPYKDEKLPDAPKELVVELSARYIHLFETITGTKFVFPDETPSIKDRLKNNLKNYF